MRSTASRQRPKRLGLTLAALAMGSCTDSESTLPGTSAPPSPPELEVEYAGCDVIQRGTCFAGSSVTIWARSEPGATLSLTETGTAVEAKTVDGGRQWRVPTAQFQAPIRIQSCVGGACSDHVLVVRTPGSDLDAALNGDLDAELAEVRTSTTPSLSRCVVSSRWARSWVNVDPAAAIERLDAAMDCARRVGASSIEVRALFVQSFLLRRAGRLTDARQRLERAASNADGVWSAHLAYHEGLLHRDLSDPSSALERWRTALKSGLRLDTSLVATVRQTMIPVLQQVGRADEALANARALLAESAAMLPEGRAQALTNVAWASILERERRQAFADFADLGPSQPAWPDPIELQTRANAIHAEAGHPDRLANGRLNLALAELQDRNFDAARRELERVHSELLTADQKPWVADVEGRLALARGEVVRGLRTYRRLLDSTESADIRWRAHLGIGRALETLGKADDALASYRAAEAVLDRGMLALGVGVGRLGFLSQRDVSSRLAFDLALRLDRPDVAARIAQQAIGRAWSSMRSVVGVRGLSGERRRLWDEALERYGALRRELNALSLDDFRGRREAQVVARARREALEARSHAALRDALELVGTTEPPKPSPVAPGTVRLTYFPGRTEWFAVVETTDRTRFVSLGGWRPGASDADALRAERLLRPVAHALDTARRVEIVPHPWLQAIDFHALDLEDAPLVTRVPVVYSMLLGARDADGDPAGAEVRTVLVVADPTGDLPEARREGQAIAARYAEDRAYRVQLLMGPEAAASRLVAMLSGIDVFHYAGHARFDPSGLGSSLELAKGERLSAADVLALPRGPKRVVLSGCETATLERAGQSADIGLAQAFILRGARSVIATQRMVKDGLARTVSVALHSCPDAMTSALHRIQSSLAGEDDGDWAAFRAYVP